MESAKADRCEKIMTLKLQQENENYDIQLKKIQASKGEELHILIENDDSDSWEFSCSHQFLVNLDSIFKKFPDITDVMELICENNEAGQLRAEISGQKLLFYFTAKFIKAESTVRLDLQRRSKDDENPLATELRCLRREIEQLKFKKKVPVINHVGDLQNNGEMKGELILKATQTVIFHLFADYRVTHGTNNQETITMQVKNDYVKDPEEEKEKTIYQGWFGMYNAAMYQESRNFNLMFGVKMNKGKNKIVLKKAGNGTATLTTLHLIAEP